MLVGDSTFSNDAVALRRRVPVRRMGVERGRWVVVALLLIGAAAWPCLGAEPKAFRWVDRQGQVNFGDVREPGAEPVALESFDQRRLRYRVVKVPDGDTIYLANGDRIRLLGVNAPEVAHHNRPGEPGGDEAADALRGRLLGETVGLEFDVEKKDNYGRRLAHVVDDDGRSLNRWLVEQGLAFVFLHPPNLKHAQDYLAAEADARAAGRGIWALPRYQVISMRRADQYRNSFRRLRGRLQRVDHKRKYSYLHFREGLVASLPRDALASFAAAGLDPDSLVGEHLVVRGWVRRNRGKPSLFLNYPQQIESHG